MSIKKKLLLTVATVAAVFCMFSMSVSAMGTDLKTANANVNLRTGPGTQYPVITVVPAGSQLYINQDVGGWLFVEYQGPSGGILGYVSSQYVGAQQPVYQPVQTYGVGNYTVSNAVNLRSGPSTAYAAYFVIPAGSTVYVNSSANGWSYVSFGAYNGYVATQYINGLGGGSSSSTSSSRNKNIAYAGDEVLTSKDFTNLYVSPDTGSSVVQQLCAGSRLSVLERGSGWYKVSYNGYNGWIPASALCKALGGAALTT